MKRFVSLLIGALVATSAGCNLFPHLVSPSAEKTDKAPTPMVGAPSKHVTRVAQFWFFSDVKLQEDHRFFKDVASHRENVYRELRLPPSNKDVLVYLFDTKENFEAFLAKNHPKLPERRAFFVAQALRKGGNEDLMVYTYLNETIQKDLRHELTHAMLHSVLKGVPIWLDEGLAEYFELPVEQKGVNPKHLENLRQAGMRFDLERLEKLEEVHDMTPAEYRESWAWVHLMLRTSPQAKQALLSYLQDLRTNSTPGALRPRLANVYLSPDTALQNHLVELERTLPRGSTAKR